jgi:hypothetical protein
MKKLPLLLLGCLLISKSFAGQEKKPVPPPTALCTAGVPSSECKEITEYLGLAQQGTMPTRLIQFVVADNAAYKTEKDRATAVTNNSPLLERPFLFSVMDSFYKVNEPTGGLLLDKVYFNESASCHEPVIEASGKISDTKFGNYDYSRCDTNLDYDLGFIEGSFQGASNATNWEQCTIDEGQQDGKACRKR